MKNKRETEHSSESVQEENNEHKTLMIETVLKGGDYVR